MTGWVLVVSRGHVSPWLCAGTTLYLSAVKRFPGGTKHVTCGLVMRKGTGPCVLHVSGPHEGMYLCGLCAAAGATFVLAPFGFAIPG